MKEQFCNYEISKKLKELGFDEKCFGCFINDIAEPMDRYQFILGSTYSYSTTNHDTELDYIMAPLWQQAIDWLRENRDIDIVITPDTNSQHRIPLRKYFVTFWKYYNGLNVQPEILRYGNKILYFVNPEKAREQAILKAIELCQNLV